MGIDRSWSGIFHWFAAIRREATPCKVGLAIVPFADRGRTAYQSSCLRANRCLTSGRLRQRRIQSWPST